MKKIKLLTATIIVLSMLFTVAFASVNFGGTEVAYTGENLVVSVYSSSAQTVCGGSYVNVGFDKTKWEYVGVTFADTFASAEVYADTDYYSMTLDGMNAVTLTENQKLFDITLRALTDDVNDSEIYFVDDDCWCDGSYATIPYSGSIKVVAGSTSETKEATVTETPIVDKAGNTWTFTDAKAFSISATGFTKTSGTISCELTLANSTGTPKVLTTNPVTVATFENATITFQALVHGIDDGVTITGATGSVTVE